MDISALFGGLVLTPLRIDGEHIVINQYLHILAGITLARDFEKFKITLGEGISWLRDAGRVAKAFVDSASLQILGESGHG